jgi:hypothetical protein
MPKQKRTPNNTAQVIARHPPFQAGTLFEYPIRTANSSG